MYVQYSFVTRRRGNTLKPEPIILPPSLAVIAGIGAMIATTCAFILA